MDRTGSRSAAGRALAGVVVSGVGAFAVGLSLGAVSGCSSSSPGAPAASTPATMKTVKLVQNPWDASRLDVAIADILLTDQLGMTVQVTELDEYSQWPFFASGDEHACLEVWPSGHAEDIANYVQTGKVENGGTLGPIGKISWYVPTYLLTANPRMSTWQYFQSATNTVPLETAQTGTMGRFLSGDKTWTSYDAEIIKNLGLNLEVIYEGSEEAELAELDMIYQRRGAVLLYLWSPHAALAKYELTPVELPAYSDACYAAIADGGVSCDYPPDHLFKIFWPGLKTANPRAYALLEALTISSEDQIALLNLVDNQGYSIVQAAKWWIDQPQNKTVWQTWIPK